MDHSGKFFPRPTPETAPYWDGCRRGELLIQQCRSCGNHQFYPRIVCTRCMSRELDWVTSVGRGEVISFTVVRLPVSKAYADDVPYTVALVKLAEGPTMMTNIVECEPEAVSVGLPVEVLFEQWSDEITIPKFRPVTA